MNERKPERAVIFGGTGFVGTQLAAALVKERYEVLVMSRRPQRHRELLVLPGTRLVQGSIHDCQQVSAFVDGADLVVNLVGILNESGDDTFDRVHARFPENLAAACIERGAGKLVHISSLGTAADAPSEYLRSKARGELAVVASMDRGLNATVYRPSIIYGPNDGFTRMFSRFLKLAKGFFPVVCADAQMQPVYIQDVVRCVVQGLRSHHSSGNCYELAGPEVFSLLDLISIINELTGCNRRLIPLSHAQSKLAASFMQHLPGKPLTPDNVLSMQVPNVSECGFPEHFDSQPRQFRHTAAGWLRGRANRLDAYREQARR